MGSTRPETDAGSGVTSLADALRTDEPEDTRDCPHESCEGSLSLTDDDRVLCQTCRCTPDGVFLPPEDWDNEDNEDEGSVPGTVSAYTQATFFREQLPVDPSWTGEPHPWRGRERDRYRHSGKVRLLGGFTEAWPHEQTTRDGSIL